MGGNLSQSSKPPSLPRGPRNKALIETALGERVEETQDIRTKGRHGGQVRTATSPKKILLKKAPVARPSSPPGDGPVEIRRRWLGNHDPKSTPSGRAATMDRRAPPSEWPFKFSAIQTLIKKF